MDLSTGVWLLLGANALVVGLATLVLWYAIKRGGTGGSGTGTMWYEETQRLATEVEQAATGTMATDVERDLLPLSTQLKRHAAEAPAAVDPTLQRQTYQLGVECEQFVFQQTGPGAETDGVFPEDRLGRIRDRAASLRSAAGAQR